MFYDRVRQDFEDIIKTEGGRRVISALLEVSGLESNHFNTDVAINAYWQGRASIGQELLHLLREIPDGLKYEKLMREEARAPTGNSKNDFYDNFV